MNTTVYSNGYVDEYGNPIERTPHTHKFNYDGFVTHRVGPNSEANLTVYSDHLLIQDYKKTRELMTKHFKNEGDYYTNRKPNDIEAFLRERLNKPNLKLIFIMEYCHQQSGYPYWRFDVNTGENAKA